MTVDYSIFPSNVKTKFPQLKKKGKKAHAGSENHSSKEVNTGVCVSVAALKWKAIISYGVVVQKHATTKCCLHERRVIIR